jgi:hypothetical protein
MNDITILDLFWLIVKFLAALGLVGLIALALYFVWKAAKAAAKTTWDILRGRNASVTLDEPIHAARQYSSGKSRVVADRSASVIIHSFSPASVW